jgi:hypothetical protein
MSTIPIREVRAEFARRKVQFHPDESYDEIRLWGLFRWGEISKYIKSGQILTDMRKEHVTIWCKPSQEEWEQYVKPLIKEHTLRELTVMAGWPTVGWDDYDLARR